MEDDAGFDRGKKIYAGVLGGILLAGILTWVLTLDFRLAEIDQMLQQDPEITAYPYKFRALEIQDRTAVMSSPRSTSLPAVRFLGIIKPDLARKSDQDPEMIAAQKELGALQSRVRELVLSRPDIDQVRWQLDEQWYANRGIFLP
jgi:hypothetical protein